jgi:hypothetical protein
MLCLPLVERRKKEEKIGGSRGIFPRAGGDTPCWLCWVGFLWLLGAIKG